MEILYLTSKLFSFRGHKHNSVLSLLGRYTCALFLRISQHLLTPHYIYDRVKAIGKQFRLRLVICLIDVEDFELALKEVS